MKERIPMRSDVDVATRGCLRSNDMPIRLFWRCWPDTNSVVVGDNGDDSNVGVRGGGGANALQWLLAVEKIAITKSSDVVEVAIA